MEAGGELVVGVLLVDHTRHDRTQVRMECVQSIPPLPR